MKKRFLNHILDAAFPVVSGVRSIRQNPKETLRALTVAVPVAIGVGVMIGLWNWMDRSGKQMGGMIDAIQTCRKMGLGVSNFYTGLPVSGDTVFAGVLTGRKMDTVYQIRCATAFNDNAPKDEKYRTAAVIVGREVQTGLDAKIKAEKALRDSIKRNRRPIFSINIY